MSKKKGGAKAKSNGAVASNPKARHDYEILETMEAGMALTGSEVKSLRGGSASMRESFAIIRDGEPRSNPAARRPIPGRRHSRVERPPIERWEVA